MTRRLAPLALVLALALPANASAHTITGLVHDARDVVLRQAPGTHASIADDGVHLELQRAGARVVHVLDLQGRPALRLDSRGAWARTGTPIVAVLAVTAGAPDPLDPRWLRIGSDRTLRFHYPGTHGGILKHWSVPLRVDGRLARIEGAVERVARPPIAWAIGTAIAHGEGAATSARPWGVIAAALVAPGSGH